MNRLPNTTIWGVFPDAEGACEAFDRARECTERVIGRTITLEKRFATKMASSLAISDRRKKPEARWTGETAFETSRLHQVNDPFFK